MTIRIVVVYHSEGGRTRALADAVVRGAAEVSGVHASAIDVHVAKTSHDELAKADAIVFGSPTYMGSASAAFKAFMDDTAPIWALQGWRDKLAAAFTHSSAPSGDKLGTLMQLAVFAAQHGMIWVGLGLPPSYASPRDVRRADDPNRLGSHLGAMAQSPPGSGATVSESDLRTCVHLGKRVGEHAVRWRNGLGDVAPIETTSARHRSTDTWEFPPRDRPEMAEHRRTNVRELAARPERYEHHLVVLARAGGAQLELATASEPLYFGHINVSDELALALPTGDGAIDGFPLRTFLTDATSGEDVARYNHRVGDLVLHPLGTMHWPGRLRPPFEPFVFPEGMRRCGLSLVFCASSPTPSSAASYRERPSRDGDAKAYVANPPALLLDDLFHGDGGCVARVGDASLSLVVEPAHIDAPRGAYVFVLEARRESVHAQMDLIHVAEGAALDARGIVRALVLEADTVTVEPPPVTWDALPQPLFAPIEDRPRTALPISMHGVELTEVDAKWVNVAIGASSARVPRYWLARMLFRVALHRPLLGYVETYGGFFFDDRADRIRVGLRGGADVALAPPDALALVELMYRAVAPEDYRERI